MREANALIADLAEKNKQLTYVDIASPMLDDEGKPKALFVEDGLHLNEKGYRIWNETLRPYLKMRPAL